MKIITPEHQAAGDAGVKFIEQYSLNQGWKYEKTSITLDLEQGIDCLLNSHPTDVKNTPDIYICQIFTDSGKINVRHPFKKTSKVTHYAVVSVKLGDITKGKFIEHVEIKERLLRDYISKSKDIKEFYKQLQGLEGKKMKEFGISQSQACLNIKKLLLPFLNTNSNITYTEPTEAEGEISFRLHKTKVSKVPLVAPNLDIKSILAKHKEPISTIKENIITINV